MSDGNGDSHFKGTIVQGSDPHSQSKIENNDSGDLVIMNYTAKQVLTDLDFDTSKIVMK